MLVKCKACEKEIAKGVKKCPGCGADQRNFFGKHKILTGILAIVIIGSIGSALGDEGKSSTTTATTTPPTTTTTQVDPVTTTAPAPAPTPVVPTVKTYKAGMYKIGSDMPAGEYVLIGSGPMSYFEVDKDSTGEMSSILANDTFGERSIITIADGQYLKLTGCIAYAFTDAPKVKLTDGFLSAGMYKVGVDLPAGEYKVIPDGSMSYKEVSKDSSHLMGSIISNDIIQGEGYSAIKNGQYLKLVGAKIKVK